MIADAPVTAPSDPIVFREHRGSLKNSLDTSVELKPTMEALVEKLKDYHRDFYGDLVDRMVIEDNIVFEHYAFDGRIQQHVFHITVKGLQGLVIINRLPDGVVLPL